MAIERSTFPLPDIDEPLTAPFFAAAGRDELAIPWCSVCARFVWYPEAVCPRCSGALEWRPVSGRATLFSWAVVERVFLPAFAQQVPYVTALVALVEDPAVRICTYVVDSDAAALRAELACEAVFRELSFPTVEGVSVRVPMFRVAPR
jgi:uncharacterized protein